jgi:delta 1-pyrroline-5-carboxylate dehydrogenase
LTCRQAGTGKKAGKSFILRRLGEKSPKRQQKDFTAKIKKKKLMVLEV